MRIVRTVGQAFEVCHKLSINAPTPDEEDREGEGAGSERDSEPVSDKPKKGRYCWVLFGFGYYRNIWRRQMYLETSDVFGEVVFAAVSSDRVAPSCVMFVCWYLASIAHYVVHLYFEKTNFLH